MARITCKYSSVIFNCEHMPIGLSHEYHHPLFSVPQKKLLNLAGQWSANKLTPTESYLLYLSLLHSTDLIIWRSPARYTEKTSAIVSSNMEHLIKVVGRINLIKHPAFQLPKMAITYDTGSLEQSFYWIQAWRAGIDEFMSDFIDAHRREEVKHKLERRESSLERMIKNPQMSEETLADNLAHWARLSYDFPEDVIEHPHTGKKLSRADFWEEVIVACAKEEKIWRYAKGTIHTIIEHIEENMGEDTIGTIYSNNLMKLLKKGLQRRADYTGFGDVDLAGKKTTFKLLDASASAEEANLIAAIQAAPEKEPIRSNYPSLGAYLKAKLNWEAKKNMGGSGS